MRDRLSPSIASTLLRVADTLYMSRDELFDLLKLTEIEFNRIRSGRAVFNINSLHLFCNKIDLSISLLFSGEIDFHALKQQYRGAKLALPEKYSDPTIQLGRARTVIGMTQYINALHGPEFVHILLRRLQLQSVAFLDPDAFINPYIITDLMSEIIRAGFDRGHLIEIGKGALKVNSANRVGRILRSMESPKAIYEAAHSQIIDQHYDHMFRYQIRKLSGDGMTMITTPRKEAHERLGTKLFGTRETCLYRQGVYGSFVGHIGHEFPKIKEEGCLYLGDSRCVYHLKFAKKAISRQKSPLGLKSLGQLQ